MAFQGSRGYLNRASKAKRTEARAPFAPETFLADLFDKERHAYGAGGLQDHDEMNYKPKPMSNLEHVMSKANSGDVNFAKIALRTLGNQNSMALIKNATGLDSYIAFKDIEPKVIKLRKEYKEIADNMKALEYKILHYKKKYDTAKGYGMITSFNMTEAKKHMYNNRGTYKKKLAEAIKKYEEQLRKLETFNGRDIIDLDTRSKYTKEIDAKEGNRFDEDNENYHMAMQGRVYNAGTPYLPEGISDQQETQIRNLDALQGLNKEQITRIARQINEENYTGMTDAHLATLIEEKLTGLKN